MKLDLSPIETIIIRITLNINCAFIKTEANDGQLTTCTFNTDIR